jgi:hypothetical protein
MVMRFNNLKGWMLQNKIKPDSIYLVVNGRELKGRVCRGPDASYQTLEFDLTPVTNASNDAENSRDTWRSIITELLDDSNLHVSVGWGAGAPFPTPVDVPFSIFSAGRTTSVVVLLLAMLVGFGVLSTRTDMLRDSPAVDGIQQPYSLARCQMAWWFFVVMASFCFIWVTIDNHDSLTSGALILMGISAATGLAGTVVGGNPDTDAKTLLASQTMAAARVALQARLDALSEAIALQQKADKAAAVAGAPENPGDSQSVKDLKAEQMKKTVQLQKIDSEGVSDGFLPDILRDDDGISFHRFQMVGWTLVLGLVFIVAVYQQIAMPDFSPTLLGLMGISNGTYIGFKISNASSS